MKVYWSMITRKPRFLKLCEHQSKAWAFLLSLVQFIPSTLAILVFAEDTAIKVEVKNVHFFRYFNFKRSFFNLKETENFHWTKILLFDSIEI